MAMNCERIAELLPDYLQGALGADDAREVADHLQHCAVCFDEVAVWKELALLPTEQPSPESRERFEAMLHAFPSAEPLTAEGVSYRPAEREGDESRTRRVFDWGALLHWLRSPVGAVAWSLGLLVIGVLAGTRIGENKAANSQELAAMHAELTNMRQLVVLSMLQQQSASERLQGVTFTSLEDHLDPQVLSALLRTLRYDNSVDVRLAALDALSRHANQPQIRKDVVDALQEQQSPLVQVALIDLLTEWRDPDAAQRLRNFQQTPNLNPTVRQRAEWAVSKLQ
jgi:HEAT repeats/Putative zinc-finger